jgi:hypothetical protein
MKLKVYSPPDEKAKQVFRSLGGDDFDQMRTYLFDMYRSMQNQKELLKQSHTEELKLFPLATDLTNRVHAQYLKNYEIHFVGLLLNSAHVASHSIFEIMFKKVCQYSAKKNSIEIPSSYFGTSGITYKCKHFIEHRIGLDLSQIDKHWKRLTLFLELRNKITHHAATIPVDRKALRKFARANEYIQLNNPRSTKELSFYIKDRLFVYDFLDTSSSYLIWILMRI